MAGLGPWELGLSALSSLFGLGQQGAASNEAGGLFGQAMHMIQQALGQYAGTGKPSRQLMTDSMNSMDQFITNPGAFDAQTMQAISGALAPMFAATENQFQTGAMRDVNSMMNQAGPGMANPGGFLQDALNSILQGQTNVASQNASTGAQAGLSAIGQRLGGIQSGFTMGNDIAQQVAGILTGGAGMSMQAGQGIAGNLAQSANPFNGFMSMFQDPNVQSWLSGLFTPKNPGQPAQGANTYYGGNPVGPQP